MDHRPFFIDIPVFVISKEALEDILAYAPDWWGNEDKATYDNLIFIIPPATFADVFGEIGELKEEFEKIKNDLSHASFYDAGKWLAGENGRVYVHVQRGNETLHLVVMNNEHIAGGTSVYEVVNQFQAFKSEDISVLKEV